MQRAPKLQRTMGLRELISLGIGGTIGGAIFVLVGMMIGQAGSLGALLSFVVAAGVALLILLPYTELSCRYPSAGGGYAFAYVILGRHWGFLMGWIYASAWLFIGSYVVLGFGHYFHQALTGLLPFVKDSNPFLSSIGLIVVLTAINLAGGQFFGRVQKGIVLPVAVILMVGSAAGLVYITASLHNGALFALILPHSIGGVLAMAPFAFLALAGFDMIATTGEEIKNPQRALPFAFLITLGVVLLLYLLVTATTAGALSSQQLHSKTPLADAARQIFGGSGQQVIALIAALTTAATVNAVLIATSRVTFAMARDGLIPRFFAKLHPETKVPWVAVLANGLFLMLFAFIGNVGLLAAIGSFLYVLQFLFPLIAVIVARRRSPIISTFKTPAPYVIIPLAFGGCLLLLGAALYTSGQAGVKLGVAWLLFGGVTYALAQTVLTYVRRRSYLKKGYAATRHEIALLKKQIILLLHDPELSFERLRTVREHIAALNQLRSIKTEIEETRQRRMAQARIREFKRLRHTQAHAEKHALFRALQSGIADVERVRAEQARKDELQFIQTIEADAEEDISIIHFNSALAKAGISRFSKRNSTKLAAK